MEVQSNRLVNSHQVLWNVPGDGLKVSLWCLFESRFKIFLGFKLVVNFLLTDTKTFEGKSLALNVLKFIAYVKASLMEVTGSFKVVQLFKILGNLQVSFKTFFNFTFPLECLSIHQRIFQLSDRSRRRVHNKAGAFVQLKLFLKQGARVDVRGGFRLRVSQVEKINVGLHVTLSEQFNSQSLSVNFLI